MAIAALASIAGAACMTSPKHGQAEPTMGAVIGLVAYAGPGAVFTYEYALFRFDGAGYVIDEWRPLAKCTATGPIFTDVQGVQWQGCAVATELPVTDCTNGGRGAWHGNAADRSSPQRFARVRARVNNGSLFVFPSSVTDAQLQSSYNSVGGLQTIVTYQVGTEAEIHVETPSVGAAGFADSVRATDVVVVGDRAYAVRNAGSGPELGIFEVADPGTVQLRKTVEIGAGVNKIAVDGDYAYLATDDPAGQLVIVSILDPDNAAVVKRVALNGSEPAYAVAAVGGMVLIGRKNRGAGPELEVWTPLDAAHLTDLVPAGTFEIGADVNAIDVTAGLYIAGQGYVDKTLAYLATSHPTNKVWGLDLTNPANVVSHSVAALSGGYGMRDVEYHHGFVYAVADNNSGPDVFVFQVGGTDGSQLTLSGSRALDADNTGVAFYGDSLLVSSRTASKALTVLDPAQSPPAVLSVVPSGTGTYALAVRHGVAVLATNAAAQLQLVSAGLQIEPALPSQHNLIGCLGDSNTAQGPPVCSLGNPFFPTYPSCPGGETATCGLASQTSIDPVAVCPNGGTPSCPPNKGVPVCALSWCTRAGFCFGGDPLAPPSYCAVEGRVWSPRPTWAVVDPGAGLAPVLPNPDHPADGPEQMAQALGAGANAVVIALGSVDMLGNGCSGAPTLNQILAGLDDLRMQAAASPVYYVVPPPFSEFINSLDCQGGCEVANGFYCFNRAVLRFRNRMLHELPPERVIDFHSGVVRNGATPDFGGDGVHFNAAGQNRRARTALSKLAD